MQREAELVGARIWLEVVLGVVESLPLGERPWQVLDAGGGTGRLATALGRRGHRVVVAEASAGMLEAARQRVEAEGLAERVELVERDVCDLSGLSDGRFDLSLAVGGSLGYCRDAQQALRELGRVTRRGGMLFAEVENRFAVGRSGRRGRSWARLSEALRTGRASLGGRADMSVRLFEPAELRVMLQDAGWRPVQMAPGNILWALLGPEVLAEAEHDERCLAEMVRLEADLRACPDLLGAGGDIQVLASK